MGGLTTQEVLVSEGMKGHIRCLAPHPRALKLHLVLLHTANTATITTDHYLQSYTLLPPPAPARSPAAPRTAVQ